jgi:polysaccharide pyruvyl transferase WcaK-like protein
MKERLKEIIRRVWRTRAYSAVLFGLDALAFRLARPAQRSQPYTLILAPPTGENIGDQAMLDSAIENTPGHIVAVITSRSFRLPIGSDAHRTEIAVLPGLIHRPPVVRLGVVRKYAALLKGAERLIAPGADTIDGGHPHGSLARLSLISLGLRARIPTVLQGFSWKKGVAPTIKRAVSELAQHGAIVCPRDPLSRRRLTSDGVSPTTQGADLAFASGRAEPLYPELTEFITRAERGGSHIALLNTSGLIARHHDLIADYGKVIDELHRQGLRVIFTPHVHRDWDDDFVIAREVFARYGTDDDLVIDRLLSPAQIRTLARSAHITVTGRMHLAILSLGQSVPVVCLATHGKVEGLFELFELEEFVVEPRTGCGDDLVAAVSRNLAAHDDLVARVARNLPTVVELSSQNFPYRSTSAESSS